jgi:hypothetical protein
MTSPIAPAAAGLPFRTGSIRFAVGAPDGLTSNSWKFWTERSGDAYLACRDNFQNMKVSLHASGRWRMAYTAEAVAENPALVPAGENRAWEVWDEPPPVIPDVVVAFRLIFPTIELGVRPDQRGTRQWRNTVFIGAAPIDSGKLTVVTLFVTAGDPDLTNPAEASFRLASLELSAQRRAQLVAHAAPEGTMPQTIATARAAALERVTAAGVEVPDTGYLYFFGNHSDGARFIVGAWARPETGG